MLDSGLLTEIFQRFPLAPPDVVDAFEGHPETSENTKDVRIWRANEHPRRYFWD